MSGLRQVSFQIKHFSVMTHGLACNILNRFLHFKLSYFTVNSLQSPYKKLKEALSSVEAFERHYLVCPFLGADLIFQ